MKSSTKLRIFTHQTSLTSPCRCHCAQCVGKTQSNVHSTNNAIDQTVWHSYSHEIEGLFSGEREFTIKHHIHLFIAFLQRALTTDRVALSAFHADRLEQMTTQSLNPANGQSRKDPAVMRETARPSGHVL